MKINCLVVDDEPLAREGLAGYVQDLDFLNLVGECESPLEAGTMLDQHSVDLIFLDVQMPKINGIDFLKTIRQPPLVILTTAYPQYALEGYQLDVLDYLLKPITFDRFYRAANKAKAQWQLQQRANNPVPVTVPSPSSSTEAENDYFFVKVDQKYEKIAVDGIHYVEAMQNYVMIHTEQHKYMTLVTLKSVAERLPSERFIQTHKSYLVAKDKITSVEGNQIFIGQQIIPISRHYRESVMEALINQKLLRR
ncbi:LytR/AlgR family response regulator transcription factor [Tunicatimonas pelagia]|uniref:LytR/AlgR family response regulator transcription factor n=1 Tax=Tunicatimonas pelagia TaxID=931531 RepID=UPI0026663ADC|nr:LytTR family DNA-binding domain-containing protein [Tunicatimonas pelagia]WKN45704.1 LytTR family DNA-binding domain-containing protein [Tunicatimonas pelagia]